MHAIGKTTGGMTPRRAGGALAAVVAMMLAGLAWAEPPPSPPRVTPQQAAQKWAKELARIRADDQRQPPTQGGIVFVGSSSIRRWPLAESFPDLACVNRGFGGSEMADAAALVDTLVIPLRPRVVVVYSGDNDLAKGRTPQQVVEAAQSLATAIDTALPETRVIFLGVKPSLKRWALIDAIGQTNKALAEFCAAHPRRQYFETATEMLDQAGQPRSDLLDPDGLHLSAAGYKLWSTRLRPVLEAALKPAPIGQPRR